MSLKLLLKEFWDIVHKFEKATDETEKNELGRQLKMKREEIRNIKPEQPKSIYDISQDIPFQYDTMPLKLFAHEHETNSSNNPQVLTQIYNSNKLFTYIEQAFLEIKSFCSVRFDQIKDIKQKQLYAIHLHKMLSNLKNLLIFHDKTFSVKKTNMLFSKDIQDNINEFVISNPNDKDFQTKFSKLLLSLTNSPFICNPLL